MKGLAVTLWGVVALAAAAQALAVEGYYLEEESSRPAMFGKPAAKDMVKTWLVPGKLRKDEGEARTSTLVDVKHGTITVVDHTQHSFFTIERGALEEMGRLGAAFMAQGEDTQGAAALVHYTGTTRKVGPWPCREAVIENRPLPGTRVTLCLSDEVGIDPALRQQASELSLGGGSGPLAKLVEELRQIKGYPVEVSIKLNLDGHSFETTQTLLKADKREIEDRLFDVPNGYKQVENPFAGLAGAAAARPAETSPEAGK